MNSDKDRLNILLQALVQRSHRDEREEENQTASKPISVKVDAKE